MNAYRRMTSLRWLVMVCSLTVALAMFWGMVGGVDPGRMVQEKARDGLLLEADGLLDVARGLADARQSLPVPDMAGLFTLKPAPLPEPMPVPTPRALPPPTAFSVDMVIAAGEQGRAILSGRLTRVGDVLRDGSRVISIQADGVTLETRGRLRRLPPPSGRVAPH